MYDALVMEDLVADELRQRTETGFDVADVASRIEQGVGPADLSQALDELATADRTAPWPYVEPDTLDLIIAELEPDTSTGPPPAALLHDRLNGAWLGRVAGCMPGKPIERGDHWTTQHIRTYLELAGAYPLNNYIPALDPMPAGYEFHPSWPTTTLGNIDGSTRDDDIDYTILNLTLLEQHGQDLTTERIGDAWLRHLPILQTYTAERAAYRNLINGLRPPETATNRNPYREWIGAAIRADAFGYTHPGQPRAAATLAHRDARLSHTGNGIYAEMWTAAMVAEALTGAAPDHIVRESVRHIPPPITSRRSGHKRDHHLWAGLHLGGRAPINTNATRPLHLGPRHQQRLRRGSRTPVERRRLDTRREPRRASWVGHRLERRHRRLNHGRQPRPGSHTTTLQRTPSRQRPAWAVRSRADAHLRACRTHGITCGKVRAARGVNQRAQLRCPQRGALNAADPEVLNVHRFGPVDRQSLVALHGLKGGLLRWPIGWLPARLAGEERRPVTNVPVTVSFHRVPVSARRDRVGGALVPAVWPVLPRHRGIAGRARYRRRSRHRLPMGTTVHTAAGRRGSVRPAFAR